MASVGLDLTELADSALARRFMRRVDVLGECWTWTGGARGEYGTFSVKGRSYGAHVVSHALFTAPVPTGLFVCHRCDNRPCVRPDHLFLGTHSDNMRDAVAKGRLKPPNGVKGVPRQRRVLIHAQQPPAASPPAGPLEPRSVLLSILASSRRPLLLHEIAAQDEWSWTRRTASKCLARLASEGLAARYGTRWFAATPVNPN